MTQQAADLLQAQNDVATLQAAAAPPHPQARVTATVFAYTPGAWGPGNKHKNQQQKNWMSLTIWTWTTSIHGWKHIAHVQ
jgi:hypothetical protein